MKYKNKKKTKYIYIHILFVGGRKKNLLYYRIYDLFDGLGLAQNRIFKMETNHRKKKI